MVTRVGASIVGLLVVAAPGLGIPEEPFDSARGGGQVVVSGQQLQRAGNTIAFTAQARPGGVGGQVEYVETSLAGSDEGVPRWHGTPTCLRVSGDTAEIGGRIADNAGSTRSGFFAILVTDDGVPAEGTDVIRIQYSDEASDCNEDWDDVDELDLARGNVRVHDA